MDRQPLAFGFFDELVKIAKEEAKKSHVKRTALEVASHHLEEAAEQGLKKIPKTKWGRRLMGVANIGRLFKGSSYIDDIEAPPSQSLMPAIRAAHGLGKSSSWMDIGPEGQKEGRAWRPVDPPFKLASAGGDHETRQEDGDHHHGDQGPEAGLLSKAAARALGVEPLEKVAEPPPPPGVSSKEWDRILQGKKPGKLVKKAYKLQGKTNVQGIPISIENRKGSVRKGTDSDGHEWRTKMKHPYGYITGTRGVDDEPVDAYVGPDKEAPNAFVVHQHKDDGKGYDEDKVMLGFSSKAAAKAAYLAHYDDPKFLGPISRVSIDRLRELVRSKKKLVKIHE